MLIGNEISLGPILQADAPALFRWRNSPEVMHLDGLYRPLSEPEFDAWFTAIGQRPDQVVFAIRGTARPELLGYVEVLHIQPVQRSAELAIMIGDPANRGHGYGREALRLCTAFCWDELNLRRLSLHLLADNLAAQRAYQAAGFQREGLLRQAIFSDGRFRDVLLLAQLRDDAPTGGAGTRDSAQPGRSR